MAANKVVFGNKVLIDLTGDTVTEEALLKGYTAHKADGTIITGTAFAGYPNEFVLSLIHICVFNMGSSVEPLVLGAYSRYGSHKYLLERKMGGVVQRIHKHQYCGNG